MVSMLLYVVINSVASAGEAPSGPFDNAACVECHEERDQELVKAWRTGGHGKDEQTATCVACHGKTHEAAADKARRNQTCIGCHGGEKAPEVHSYTTSKHGVIYRLEQRQWDWSLPLEQANYRAPGCAYCHMHRGNHNVTDSIHSRSTGMAIRGEVKSDFHYVCLDCHAPRYVRQLFDNGDRMRNIGRLKLREASILLEEARSEYPDSDLATANTQQEKMRVHLRNIYLGVGHQSPDYQWWHGQPALDGDLLRIKGEIGELRRRRAVSDSKQPPQ